MANDAQKSLRKSFKAASAAAEPHYPQLTGATFERPELLVLPIPWQ
jgi:hypothetical protein